MAPRSQALHSTHPQHRELHSAPTLPPAAPEERPLAQRARERVGLRVATAVLIPHNCDGIEVLVLARGVCGGGGGGDAGNNAAVPFEYGSAVEIAEIAEIAEALLGADAPEQVA